MIFVVRILPGFYEEYSFIFGGLIENVCDDEEAENGED